MSRKIDYTRFGQHLLFWVAFLLFRLSSATTTKSLIGDYWWGDWKILHLLVVEVAFKALFTYGVIYFLVPRFLDTKKYISFGISTFAWLYLVIAGYIASHYYYLEKIYTIFLWWDKESMTSMFGRLTNLGFLLHLFSNFLFPSIIFGAIQFYKKKMLLSKIEEERNKMELMALKNQLNPHFLFNTLNNLYSYVVTGSPKAPDMILRLSGILDYVLYKSQNKLVPLKDEVSTIEDFIGLEKIRYGDRLQVDCVTEGDTSIAISPLLLLSLVENAFKHGASGDIDQAKIKINIKAKDGLVNCVVWNSKSKHEGELNDSYKKGIGLSNIKRQLKLIYPDRNELVIDDQPDAFNVTLQIEADKN